MRKPLLLVQIDAGLTFKESHARREIGNAERQGSRDFFHAVRGHQFSQYHSQRVVRRTQEP